MAKEPMVDNESEEMPAQAQGKSGASELVARIHSDMTQLADLMEKSGAVDPEDIQKFSGIVSAYRQFVEQDLGSAPGAKPQQPQEPMMSQMPAMAGAAQVKPAL